MPEEVQHSSMMDDEQLMLHIENRHPEMLKPSFRWSGTRPHARRMLSRSGWQSGHDRPFHNLYPPEDQHWHSE